MVLRAIFFTSRVDCGQNAYSWIFSWILWMGLPTVISILTSDQIFCLFNRKYTPHPCCESCPMYIKREHAMLFSIIYQTKNMLILQSFYSIAKSRLRANCFEIPYSFFSYSIDCAHAHIQHTYIYHKRKNEPEPNQTKHSTEFNKSGS